MAAGVKSSPAKKETTLAQNIYEIAEAVADRFKISPFEVMEKPFDEVVDIWTGAVISAQKKDNKDNPKEEGETRKRVYSWNATWH